ncbi:MAG: elongation factor Ts [Candidatus Nomurabacteria bacterium]|jgi:elongation factor Ts|nr:elongation factor Ts [Candidatus Nomurabacteria bacterium]
MSISIDEIKRLKELTGVGLTDAKAALTEANGDFDAALKAMREKGLTKAEKRSEREARAGLVEAYVHDGRIGVLVELNCETDFVARTDDFKALAHDIAMQVAAMNPAFITADDVPAQETERKTAELIEAAKASGKPAEIAEKAVAGQLKKYFAELTLYEQTFWKDDKLTIADLVKNHIAKLGENIVVRQMRRVELGVSE